MNTSTTTSSTAAVAGSIGFLAAYLAASPVSDALADRPLPLPGTPAPEVAAYFAANPAAVTASAVLQVVSVACFAVFVLVLAPLLRGTRLPLVGGVSVAAMVVSSLLAAFAAAVAAPGAADLVFGLRAASFSAGGVANVATLGAFVLGAAVVLGRRGVLGKPGHWFGYVAGALAVLSVLSLGIYYATALLPVGRVLCMVWTIVAAVRWASRA